MHKSGKRKGARDDGRGRAFRRYSYRCAETFDMSCVDPRARDLDPPPAPAGCRRARKRLRSQG